MGKHLEWLMSFLIVDRVKETSTVVGTGNIILNGAAAGYRPFSIIGDGNTTYYAISSTTQWEVGIGIYVAANNSLQRNTILSSSNSDNIVNFDQGTKTVVLTQPAERAVWVDGTEVIAANNAKVPNSLLQNSAITINGNAVALGGSTVVTAATTTAATFNDGGAGAASGTTFNGSVARTISYNTIGAPSTTGTNASGTWAINISGVAATATILATTRTIWGQNFNGSANVSGALTGVTDITASGDITLSAGTANGVAYLNGSKVLTTGSALVFDGTNLGNTQNTASPIGVVLTNSSASTSAGTRILFQYAGPTTTGYILNQFDGSDFNNTYQANQHHIWLNGATEQMRLTSTGLGIGTSSPTEKLTVNGNILQTWAAGHNRFIGTQFSTTYENGLRFLEASRETQIISKAADSNDKITFYTGVTPTERMRLDTSGNLGLGVTPSAWGGGFKAFQVGTTGALAGGNNSAYISTNWYQDSGTTNRYLTTGAVGLAGWEGNTFKWYNAPSGTAGNAITFTQAMTLDAAGNLGVGITSPAVKLNVGGSGNQYVRLETTSGAQCDWITTSSDTYFGPRTNTALAFQTNNTERARIDAAGNLGLGVTPSAWNLGRAVEAGFIGNALWSVSATQNNLTQNAYYASGWKYGSTNPATYYNQQSGAHAWYIAPSGTAGAAISFTQAMTLDAAGNLLVGGTGNVFGYKQEITGTSGSSPFLGLSVYNTSASQGAKIAFLDNANSAAVGNIDGNLVFYAAGRDNERARIDAAGNLGLGVTPSAWGSSSRVFEFRSGYGAIAGNSTDGSINVTTNAYQNNASAWIYNNSFFASRYQQVNGQHQWFTAPSGTAGNAITFTQAMTLDASGDWLLGTTVVPAIANTSGVYIYGAGQGQFFCNNAASLFLNRLGTDGAIVNFRRGASNVGDISVTGSATAYNTSSDYRLKNIAGPITNSGAYIDSLNPVEGTWKSDGSTFVGLIAHEVQKASRTQVATGEKDGNEMQSMDYSSPELIANLIAEIKSLRARVAQLETQLKGA
jgi:hypothetical protein